MTTNGYDIVNIIQISIILMYPVTGRDWEIPMKLKQSASFRIVKKYWLTMLSKPRVELHLRQ